MAEILIKIKIEGNSNALAFVERTQPYLSKTLKEIRQDIVSEVGELLPQNFKFVRTITATKHAITGSDNNRCFVEKNAKPLF